MAAGASSGGRNHIPALDGLRGVAVAAVVLYHLGYLSGGFLGVDLFFVLSGYLITTVIVSEWVRTGSIDLRAFWTRRARRLLPAAFAVLAAVAVFGAVWAAAIDRGPIRSDGLAALFYVANWHQIWVGTNYFDLFRSKSPLEHMWSLSVEEQFYLAWPLIVVATLRARRRDRAPDAGLVRLFVVALGLATASVVAMVMLYDRSGSIDRVYYGTDTRSGAILMGAALAVAHLRWGRALSTRAAQVLDLVAILFIGAVALTWTLADGTSSWLYEGGFAAIGLGVCVVMAALVTPTRGVLGAVLSFTPVRVLGRISYAVYLWHWPVIVALTPERSHLDGVALSVLRVAVTLAVSLLSAVFIEVPVRQWRVRPRAALSGGLIGAAACAALLVMSTTASTSPFSEEIALAKANPGQLVVATDPPTTAVTPHDAQPAAHTLVVGDSGAYFLGAGMTRVSHEYNAAIINRGTVGCGVARGDGRLRLYDGRMLTDTKDCDKYPLRWQRYVDDYRPQRVIIVLADVGGGQRFVEGAWMGDCNPRFDAFFRFEIAQGVRILRSRGAQVTVTTIPDVVGDAGADSRHLDCRNAALIAGATSQGAQILDLRHWACPTPGTCLRRLEGQDMRPDRVHFLGPGADMAARWVLDRMKD